MNDPRGSLWRKWDLHFHLSSSEDNCKNKNIPDEIIVDTLKSKEISVVAITDHHIIDTQRIKAIKELAKDSITVFPGIELRSELGGHESVHFVGIFPEDCDIDSIWTKLQGPLKIHPSDVREKGDDAVYVDFKESAKLIHELGGIITVHAGKKTNSIERISNAEIFKRAIKKDLVKEGYIDILEIGNVSDIDDYRTIVFPHIEMKRPMVIGSDNHNINDYNLKADCWIKADTTFSGLLQVINEPEDRIFIGDVPEKINLVASNKTKYIKSLHIYKRDDSDLNEIWFTNEIYFNPNLIAIIGNKGKGKSALADTIGLLGNTKQHKAFSFLSEANFRNSKNNKAEHFKAALMFESGSEIIKTLAEPIDEEYPELVKYIPQNYLEKICNEIGGIEETDFDRELKKVIFSHVDIAHRLGKESLEGLISYKTSEANNKIVILKQELHNINETIVDLELQIQPENRERINNLLIVKKQELDAHETSKPDEVQKPENDPIKQKEILKISEKIEEAKKKQSEFERLIEDATKIEIEQNYNISIVEKLMAKIENFKRQIETFKNDSRNDLERIGLQIENILVININEEPLCNKRNFFYERKKEAKDQLNPNNIEGAFFKKQEIEKSIEQLSFELDGPNKMYQDYKAVFKAWTKNRNAIIGSEIIADSIKYYETQLCDLHIIPIKLTELRDHRLIKAKEIHNEITKLADAYRELYQPVHQFIQTHHLAKDKICLDFEVETVDTGFQNNFFSQINRGVAGTFCGVNEGTRILNTILQKHDFNTEKGIEAFLNEIVDSLLKDKRGKDGGANIAKQLKKGQTVISLYDFIYSLDYLKPRYTLKMGDKELHQLSPGERGTLLLIFYLLIDKDDIPLIIDQPEENLDNQTVFELLVPCIKEAKERRQIFIVTHNPNLAVVCDAEQIICASLDKQGNYEMEYLSGSIENPQINKAVVDILEGTRPAFDNRESKYLTDVE